MKTKREDDACSPPHQSWSAGDVARQELGLPQIVAFLKGITETGEENPSSLIGENVFAQRTFGGVG